MIELRDYQEDTVRLIYEHLNLGHDPVAEVPTGGGKSLIQARLCIDITEKWGGRVLCCTHVKELIAQNRNELKAMAPLADCGVYSAGLNRRETQQAIIFGGIQSIYPNAERSKVQKIGPVDLIIVDEAHLVSPKDGTRYKGMIDQFRLMNPKTRLVGLSATPMRLGQGWLHEGDGALFTALAKSPLASMTRLISMGYLAPVRTKEGTCLADLSEVRTRGGEFVEGDLQDAFADDRVIDQAVSDMLEAGSQGRRSWLVFCTGVDNAETVASRIREKGVQCEVVIGDTAKEDRAEYTEGFKAGEVQCLVSVGVLTTGFNARGVDLLVLLRATKSVSLYLQMVGRGTRTAEGKTDCLVLDYGGNVERLGPIDNPIIRRPSDKRNGDATAPVKKCPECREMIAAGCASCPACGHEFPPPTSSLEPVASDAPILSGVIDTGIGQPFVPRPEPEVEVEWIAPDAIEYRVHPGKRDKPPTLRVTYHKGLWRVSEFLCPEHSGFARTKAEAWWSARTNGSDMPPTADDCLTVIDDIGIREPTEVEVAHADPWPEIKGYRFDDPAKTSKGKKWEPESAPTPVTIQASWSLDDIDDEPPF